MTLNEKIVKAINENMWIDGIYGGEYNNGDLQAANDIQKLLLEEQIALLNELRNKNKGYSVNKLGYLNEGIEEKITELSNRLNELK